MQLSCWRIIYKVDDIFFHVLYLGSFQYMEKGIESSLHFSLRRTVMQNRCLSAKFNYFQLSKYFGKYVSPAEMHKQILLKSVLYLSVHLYTIDTDDRERQSFSSTFSSCIFLSFALSYFNFNAKVWCCAEWLHGQLVIK